MQTAPKTETMLQKSIEYLRSLMSFFYNDLELWNLWLDNELHIVPIIFQSSMTQLFHYYIVKAITPRSESFLLVQWRALFSFYWVLANILRLMPRSIGKPIQNVLYLDWSKISSAQLPTNWDPKHSKRFINRMQQYNEVESENKDDI